MAGVRDSLLFKEIDQIIGGGAKPVHFTWKAELYADDIKVDVYKTLFINISGDYASDWQDLITAGFKILPSIYMKQVYPNRMKLAVHLTRIPLSETTQQETTTSRMTQKLKCYLVNPVNLMENQNIDMVNDDKLDMTGLMDLQVQLADPFADAVRLHLLGMNFRSQSPANALSCAVVEAMRLNTKFYEGNEVSFDMLEPDNRRARETICLPHGMRVEDLPHHLQDKEGGIYNAGIRMFYQRGCFYVWPKYYLGGKSEDRKILTIFNLPENLFPGVERTYRETDYQLIVISTGKSQHLDRTDEIDLNVGNGIRFTDANSILESMIHVENNKAIARRGVANTELLDGDSGRGLNFAPVLSKRITANPFAAVSTIAARKGILEQFVWENACPYLAFPGMECKVITFRNGKFYERSGSLVGAEYHMSPYNDNLASNRLIINAGLSVFTSREVKEIG